MLDIFYLFAHFPRLVDFLLDSGVRVHRCAVITVEPLPDGSERNVEHLAAEVDSNLSRIGNIAASF